MSGTLLRLAAFALAIVALLELSLRFYIFGLDAISYSKMNSHLLLIDSGLVQPAANTDIYFELRPNLDTFFRGERLVSNSRGLPDKEYAIDKPDDVFRIAVVGSSWTMATSVELDETYHAILEERLNDIYAAQKFEVIDFALEFYGLGEMVANVRYKALDYDPDMIIFSIAAYTPRILWEDQKAPFTSIDTVPPFWQSYLYSTVARLAGRDGYRSSNREFIKYGSRAYMRQTGRSFEQIGKLTEGKDIEVVVIYQTSNGYRENLVEAITRAAGEKGFRFIHMHLDQLAAEANSTDRMVDGNIDLHPSPAAHKLVAEKLLNELWDQ